MVGLFGISKEDNRKGGESMRFIGDIHGNFDAYIALIQGVEESIQCGDMGIGFDDKELPILDKKHGFIRGNHDNPAVCRKHPNWYSDGLFDEEWGIFFVGGAWSIDWKWRQDRMSHGGPAIWWNDEECSARQLYEIIDWYEEKKPDIMVTHDCPTIAAMALDSSHSWDKSRTRTAFDSMFEIHKPNLWIHGHHHVSKINDIKGTRFICLDEFNFIDIKI
jgi:hypothetical protein